MLLLLLKTLHTRNVTQTIIIKIRVKRRRVKIALAHPERIRGVHIAINSILNRSRIYNGPRRRRFAAQRIKLARKQIR
jgi:hypothetical protein